MNVELRFTELSRASQHFQIQHTLDQGAWHQMFCHPLFTRMEGSCKVPEVPLTEKTKTILRTGSGRP